MNEAKEAEDKKEVLCILFLPLSFFPSRLTLNSSSEFRPRFFGKRKRPRFLRRIATQEEEEKVSNAEKWPNKKNLASAQKERKKLRPLSSVLQ